MREIERDTSGEDLHQVKKPMTYDEYLAQQMQNPEFRAEWETLEPMREVMEAIIEGKPLTDYTLEQIADAAGVSIDKAGIMQKDSQGSTIAQRRLESENARRDK